jgi:DNA mismatch repair protein MutS
VRLLINYIDETTLDKQITISNIATRTYDRALLVDATTRRNLELVANTRDGGLEGTLLEHMALTQTAAGMRLLRQWILQPLCDAAQIRQRQVAAQRLVEEELQRNALREEQRFCADLERIAARIELSVATPKELGGLRDTLERLPAMRRLLEPACADSLLLSELSADLAVPEEAWLPLKTILADNPPHLVGDGGIIRTGVDLELDRLRALRASGKAWILELEASEKARSGISSLKIKYNNILGYFIEITRSNVEKVPDNYIRRQSTVNAERFTTVELRQREQEVMGAEDKALALEKQHFESLRSALHLQQALFRKVAAALAQLDVLVSFAELMVREAYCCPKVDNSLSLSIQEGRHPVLGKRLGQAFVPNTVEMAETQQRCLILTGPNMGGKSTYIRQTGLIVIMAHMGAPVPAAAAQLGLVDRLFARIGASDNIAEGESTFMVEMREAAYILAAASERSLLLVDEIGRGTATADGLALAQAILEQIACALNCRTIFATHFHELTGLESQHNSLANVSVGSVDRDGEVYFTHRIGPGPAKRSYGLEVAKLAGLPPIVLARAKDLLETQTQLTISSERKSPAAQMHLFMAAAPEKQIVPPDYEALKALQKRLVDLDLDDMSPRDCQALLFSLTTGLKTVDMS